MLPVLNDYYKLNEAAIVELLFINRFLINYLHVFFFKNALFNVLAVGDQFLLGFI